jgi:hypothetical protein
MHNKERCQSFFSDLPHQGRAPIGGGAPNHKEACNDNDAHTAPISDHALAAGAAGLVQAPPSLAAEGTDWRFLDEVKRELKA